MLATSAVAADFFIIIIITLTYSIYSFYRTIEIVVQLKLLYILLKALWKNCDEVGHILLYYTLLIILEM